MMVDNLKVLNLILNQFDFLNSFHCFNKSLEKIIQVPYFFPYLELPNSCPVQENLIDFFEQFTVFWSLKIDLLYSFLAGGLAGYHSSYLSSLKLNSKPLFEITHF